MKTQLKTLIAKKAAYFKGRYIKAGEEFEVLSDEAVPSFARLPGDDSDDPKLPQLGDTKPKDIQAAIKRKEAATGEHLSGKG